ncbi:MAG: hypothetical protein ACRD44_09230 [Bryobacteraceae bacterium]
MGNGFRKAFAALVLFGASFGYVEAAVVVYLRAIYDPARASLRPDGQRGELFPLITLDQLRALGPDHTHRLGVEVGREAMTLLMLSAAALAVARNSREWLAAFVIAFGVWDIFFYLFLKVLIDWPASLWTWDILFLIPVPWAAPVLAPVLVSIVMIAGGATVLWRERRGGRVPLNWKRWMWLTAAGLVVVVSFTWDYPHLAAGGAPRGYPWWLLGAGLMTGCVVVADLLRPRFDR